MLTVLTGCHSDPRVAAYVDGVTITESQVDSVLSEAQNASKNDVQANQGGNPSGTAVPTPTRSEVVAVLTTKELLKRVLADKGLSPAQVDTQQLAQAFGLPAGAAYTDAVAYVQGGIVALANSAGEGFHASDADLRDVYNRGIASGLEGLGTYDQFKTQVVPQLSGFEQEIAARNELADRVTHGGITVNPRYAPLDYTVVQLTNQQTGQSFVAVPLRLAKGPAGNPVIDTPHSATPEATPAS